jgi:hypothetical protein
MVGFSYKGYDNTWLFMTSKYMIEALGVLALIMSTGSIIFSVIKLCKPGISQETRRIVIMRHITTILIFVLTNAYTTVSLFIVLQKGYIDGTITYNGRDEPWVFVLKFLFATQGFWNAVNRMTEPFFYSIFFEKVGAIFKLDKKEKKKQK